MAIQGSLEEASLPDVLQLLSLGNKTGCLSLTEGAMEGHIYLDTGRVCHAVVANRRNRLGDILIKGGRITPEQLEEAVDQQSRDSGKDFREILIESGQMEQAELDRYVRVQVEEAVYFLFTWRHGSFTFRSKIRPDRGEYLVSVDPESLLLEGARRVDEWSQIEKKIPSLDLVFRLEKDPREASDVTLTDEQQRILPFLDGGRDVNGIVDATGMVEFDVGKALYGLIAAGFAALVERRMRVRHLDYRELLAYLVHEAEFADPDRRKEAARHIVDCSACAKRLKKIHVRRTEELPAVVDEEGPATVEIQAVARAVAEGGSVSGAPDGPPHAKTVIERRQAQRRIPQERRRSDRRQAAHARPPRGQSERRSGDRRHASPRRGGERRSYRGVDRRGAPGADRRFPEGDGRAVAGAPRASAPSRRGERRRSTGPRRHPVPEPEPEAVAPPAAAQIAPVAEAVARPAPEEIPQVADAVAQVESVADEQPAPRAEATASHEAVPVGADATAETTETPALDVGVPSVAEVVDETDETAPLTVNDETTVEVGAPSTKRGAPKTREIEWLVTPRESIEMLRSRRAAAERDGATAPEPDAAPEEPVAAEAPTPAADPGIDETTIEVEAAAEPTAEVPALEAPPEPEPVVESGLTEQAPSVVAPFDLVVPPPSAAPEPAVPVAPVAAVAPSQPASKKGLPPAMRWVAMAAALVAVAGLSWFGRPLVEGRSGPAAEPGAGNEVLAQPAATAPRPEPAPTTADPAAVALATAEGADSSVLAGELADEPPADAEPQPDAGAVAPVRDPQPPRPAVPAPAVTRAPPPPIALGGAVREAGSNRPLAGVRVAISGTGRVVTSGADGSFLFRDPPVGDLELIASLDGYVDERVATRLSPTRSGEVALQLRPEPPPVVVASPEPVAVDTPVAAPPEPPPAEVREETPPPVPTPEPEPVPATPARVETDPEILDGTWIRVSREEAESELGRSIVAVPGLPIESVARPGAAGRTGIRVVQVLESGVQLELVISRPPFLNRSRTRSDDSRVSSIRVAAAQGAGETATGTGRLGSYLITAKAAVDAGTLQSLLNRLAAPSP